MQTMSAHVCACVSVSMRVCHPHPQVARRGLRHEHELDARRRLVIVQLVRARAIAVEGCALTRQQWLPELHGIIPAVRCVGACESAAGTRTRAKRVHAGMASRAKQA